MKTESFCLSKSMFLWLGVRHNLKVLNDLLWVFKKASCVRHSDSSQEKETDAELFSLNKNSLSVIDCGGRCQVVNDFQMLKWRNMSPSSGYFLDSATSTKPQSRAEFIQCDILWESAHSVSTYRGLTKEITLFMNNADEKYLTASYFTKFWSL